MREVVAWVLSFVITLMFMVVGGNIYFKIRKALSKRPHKSDDEEENPIVKFKDDLAEIYEDNPNGKLKKLAQAVWNRVEEIEKWHNEEIHDWERKYYSAKWEAGELSVKCDGYREELDEWTKRCEELQSKLNESQERLKRESAKVETISNENEMLRETLNNVEESEKRKDKFLIEKRFPGQIDTYIKITMDEEALKKAIPMNTGSIIHIDSEDLNRYSVGRGPDGNLLKDETQTKNEEFIKQLRDWCGLEASKAIEIAMPDADKEKPSRKSIYDMSNDEMEEYFRNILINRNVHNLPLNRYKVEVFKSVDNGRRAMLTEWILPATSINAIRNVLGEEGIQVFGGEELPI